MEDGSQDLSENIAVLFDYFLMKAVRSALMWRHTLTGWQKTVEMMEMKYQKQSFFDNGQRAGGNEKDILDLLYSILLPGAEN